MNNLSYWGCAGLSLVGVVCSMALVVVSVDAQSLLGETNTSARVVVASIDGEITAGTAAYVERTVREAESAKADYYLLTLNTPGGLLKATEAISRILVASPVPTIVYVNQDTGWAFSAGVFILLSADIAAMHPTASVGAATPVLSDGGDAGTKLTNATAEWLGTLAARRDRPVDLAKTLVTEARTVRGAEALELDLIDFVAASEVELFSSLGIATYSRQSSEPTLIDKILSFLSLPYLVPLLLSLGALGLVIMFRTGEIEVAGVVGLILLVLGWWGTGALTISTLGILLLLIGIALLAVEIFYEPGFGLVGVAGVVALILSLLTFANEPLFPNFFTSQLFYAALGVWVGVGGIMLFIGRLTLSAQRQPIQAGREAWYGRVVIVTHDVAPRGRVSIDGESYVAESLNGDSILATQPAQIIRITGNTVFVVPASPPNS